jgi:hypothetical protein
VYLTNRVGPDDLMTARSDLHCCSESCDQSDLSNLPFLVLVRRLAVASCRSADVTTATACQQQAGGRGMCPWNLTTPVHDRGPRKFDHAVGEVSRGYSLLLVCFPYFVTPFMLVGPDFASFTIHTIDAVQHSARAYVLMLVL